MHYLKQNPIKKSMHLGIYLGVATAAFLGGAAFTSSQVLQAYKLGVQIGLADKEGQINAVLSDKASANEACMRWWFSPKYRLSKERK